MDNDTSQFSRSRALAAEVVFTALKLLTDAEGGLPVSRVAEGVEKHAKLDDWAKQRYEKTDKLRWWGILHFFSINCVKAGFLIKKKGSWYITPEGEKALKLGKAGLLKEAAKGYKKWKAEQQETEAHGEQDDSQDGEVELEPSVTVDQVEQQAIDGIRNHISKMNPYEFQDLVAALLRGMGYYTPFVAPKGKDGGVDILAYRDAFGIESPRIKVQVKHRGQSATVKEIRELIGILQRDGDVGIFVSTGAYTPDARSTARNAHVHVELIDLDNFISLWQEFFKKLSDEDKNLLPLVPVYFLAPTE